MSYAHAMSYAHNMRYSYGMINTHDIVYDHVMNAAGLILDARRSKLDPSWVDHILFLREAFLLGTCKLEWE